MTSTEIQAAITRRRIFPQRTTDDIVEALAQTAQNWLRPGSPWRARASTMAPGPTGFSPAMVDEAVTLTFGALTRDAFRKFNQPIAAPRRVTHILSGNVPAPGIASICWGLLSQAINVVKCSHRDPIFPALFVESLREIDGELADCVTVLHWPRRATNLTQVALAGADAVIAYGDNDSLAAIRAQTPAMAKFFGYGHKVSFAIVGPGAPPLGELAARAAFDASVYDQQGCMSPHVFFVAEPARDFAAALAVAMATYQHRVPRGQLSIEEAARATSIRTASEFRSAADPTVAIWTQPPDYPWTVIYDEDPIFTPSCLNRTVFVKPIRTLATMQAWAGKISTVGVAAATDQMRHWADPLAERVCPIGQMQRPPLSFPG